MDGTEGKKDALEHKAGQSLTAGQETPEDQAKTYTEEEIEEIKAKAAQDARVAAGRDAKSLETREAAINAREEAIKAEEAKIEEIRRQRDVEELAEARGDPDKLAAYQAKKGREQEDTDLKAQRSAIKKDREQLDRDKAEHEAEIKAARETQLEIELWKIAEAEGVDPVELKDMMKDLNLTTVEQAKTVAKRLNKKPDDEAAAKKSTHDSLLTSGPKGSQEGKTARQIYADSFREKKK